MVGFGAICHSAEGCHDAHECHSGDWRTHSGCARGGLGIAGDLMGQTGQQNQAQAPSSVRPTCGTRPLTDAETAADATRVAEFTKRRTMAKASTLITIQTYVHVLHDGSEGLVSEAMIRDQLA